MRSRSSRYSCHASRSTSSLNAYTSESTRTKRTTWREMPRGRATRYSSGHSASGVAQGRVINRESGCAARNLGMRQSCQSSTQTIGLPHIVREADCSNQSVKTLVVAAEMRSSVFFEKTCT